MRRSALRREAAERFSMTAPGGHKQEKPTIRARSEYQTVERSDHARAAALPLVLEAVSDPEALGTSPRSEDDWMHVVW